MTFMKSGGIFSVLFMVFIGWVFIADSGEERIDKGCRPVQWGGTIVESITDLTIPSHSKTVDGWVDSLEFSCQYTIWRIFYEDDYLEYIETQENNSENSTSSDSDNRFHD